MGLRFRSRERWTMCSRHALRPSKVSPHLHVYFAFFGFSKPSVEASWHCGVTFSRRGVGWAGIDHTKQWEGCNKRDATNPGKMRPVSLCLCSVIGLHGAAEWASVQESGTPLVRVRVVGRCTKAAWCLQGGGVSGGGFFIASSDAYVRKDTGKVRLYSCNPGPRAKAATRRSKRAQHKYSA